MASATKDFEELLACFVRHGVRAIIVGAHALAIHAKPRYTKDLDVFVEADIDNARKIVTALEEFGFAGIGLRVDDFTRGGQVVQLGHPPNRIDLMTSIDGVTFDEAWESRVESTYGDTKFFFLGRQDLIRNKKASGRPQDLADLDVLERFTG